jgi:hypothetical protein
VHLKSLIYTRFLVIIKGSSAQGERNKLAFLHLQKFPAPDLPIKIIPGSGRGNLEKRA